VPTRLPGREEKLLLVVVTGFGKEPLLLLTNLKARLGIAIVDHGNLSHPLEN
jgi:hypothetical protein